MMAILDPEETLRSLMELAKHPVKRRNLQILHELCSEQARSKQNRFSYAEIGRLSEAAGGISVKALSNPQSTDYRKLIDIWREHSKPKDAYPISDERSWIMRIPDPAVRQVIQITIAELNKVRGENQVLRKHAKPISIYNGSALPPTHPSEDISVLTRLERNALLAAIDDENLKRHGLAKGSRGEIRKEDGTILFERGFVEAILKVIDK